MSTNHIKLSQGESIAGFLTVGFCLSISLIQAYLFVSSGDQAGLIRFIQVGAVMGPMIGSHVIARYITKSIRGGYSADFGTRFGLIAILIVEFFSIAISTVSFDGNMMASSREINLNSPEYRQIQTNIETYRNQISSLQAHADSLPNEYSKPRERINGQIIQLISDIRSEETRAVDLNVSTVDKAFDRLGATTGFTQDKVALILGILLSIVPMSITLNGGSFTSSVSRKSSSEKPAGWREKIKKEQPSLRPAA